ncbi:hypothetical protein SSS_06365 [Sarcoptes scabiei]|uniref:Uncharacterized protein n=1 Tax=Sarcoptes scabiei TaxID=52283 RepID=A0A834R5X7_SARSC|nr:hypothetical protein SSS_06365 [Sarcoptes scabiei]
MVERYNRPLCCMYWEAKKFLEIKANDRCESPENLHNILNGKMLKDYVDFGRLDCSRNFEHSRECENFWILIHWTSIAFVTIWLLSSIVLIVTLYRSINSIRKIYFPQRRKNHRIKNFDCYPYSIDNKQYCDDNNDDVRDENSNQSSRSIVEQLKQSNENLLQSKSLDHHRCPEIVSSARIRSTIEPKFSRGEEKRGKNFKKFSNLFRWMWLATNDSDEIRSENFRKDNASNKLIKNLSAII